MTTPRDGVLVMVSGSGPRSAGAALEAGALTAALGHPPLNRRPAHERPAGSQRLDNVLKVASGLIWHARRISLLSCDSLPAKLAPEACTMESARLSPAYSTRTRTSLLETGRALRFGSAGRSTRNKYVVGGAAR